MRFFLSPSPFPYGDSPYGYGDCVFGIHLVTHLRISFLPKRANFLVDTEQIYHTIHTSIAVAVAFATAAVVSCSMAGCHIDASASHPLDSASASKRLTSAY